MSSSTGSCGGGADVRLHSAFDMCFCSLVTAFHWVPVLNLDLPVSNKPWSFEFSVLVFLPIDVGRIFFSFLLLALGGTKGRRYTLTNVYNFVTILCYFIWY